MKLIAEKDVNAITEAQFSIASSGVANAGVARWGCKTPGTNTVIVEAANASQYAATNSLGANNADAAAIINAACTGDNSALTLTANPVPAAGAIFDDAKWNSSL